MFDGKFIATLFAVAISVFAICNINTKNVTSNEGFGFGNLPGTETRKELIACPSMDDYYKGNCYSVPYSSREMFNTKNITTYNSSGQGQTVDDYARRQAAAAEAVKTNPDPDALNRLNNAGKENFEYMGQSMDGRPRGEFFSTGPNFQANLSPRFDNSGQGPFVREAMVRYGTPTIENLAVPTKPLGYADMVGCRKENFTEPYGAENSLMMPNYSENNYNSLAGGDLPVTADLLPVQNMSALNGVDKNGQPTQCVFFERIIHSNRNNRRRSQGDPIRGDLPIAPINNGWFNTSANPIEDLQQGALNVIGGVSDTSTKMADFIKNASGGSKTTIGGVDISIPVKSMSTNQKMNTVQVSSF